MSKAVMAKSSACAIALVIGVAGCQNVSAPTVAVKVTEARVSPETLANIQKWCRIGAPIAKIGARLTTSAVADEIAMFVGSYCTQINAGVVPPTTDANTESWLSQNVTKLRQLLKV